MRLWLVAGAAAAMAAMAPATAAPGSKAKAQDPNEEVCKSRYLTGSRLARVTECATRQQWAEMKEQERLGLSRKQINGAPACDNSQCVPRGGKDTPW